MHLRRFFFAFSAVSALLPACTLLIDTSDLSGGPLPKDAASDDAAPRADGRAPIDDDGGGQPLRDAASSDGDANISTFVMPKCGVLKPGEEIHVEDRVTSCNGKYYIVYQADGNIVEYNANGGAVWATSTYTEPVEKGIMQPDGEFVVYGPNSKRLYGTGTPGNPGAFFWLRDNGTITINLGDKVLWKHDPEE